MPLLQPLLSDARESHNPLATCKTLAMCFLRMRPARHHSTVHQEESYVAAELGVHTKPELAQDWKSTLLFVCVALPHLWTSGRQRLRTKSRTPGAAAAPIARRRRAP